MCRTQYVLACAVALYVGLAHSFSWDFAIGSGNQLDFYFNGTILHSENITSDNIDLMIYDALHNRIFFTESQDTNTSIYSYDVSTKKIESIVPMINKLEIIIGIAFDPVEELLFWIETYGSRLSWFSLKPGFENNVYGNVLFKIPGSTVPLALTVDSCRGYIYWTSTDYAQNMETSTIERARFDGSDREVLISRNLRNPHRLVLDQQTQKLYYSVDNEVTADSLFSIESADLNGKNRTIFYSKTEIDQLNSLAVSRDFIYWVQWLQTTVNQLPKNASIHAKPTINAIALGVIVANYKIEDQIRGIQDCEPLKRLLPNNSVTNYNVSLNISSNVSLFCIHGIKASGKSQCECAHGYTGERCEVSICQNYCFQGDCSVSAKEQPTCRCNAGYSGERCEINVCRGYCLNDGICSSNEESEPSCQCKGYYEGHRCDVSTSLNKCFQKVVSMVWGIISADVIQATLDKGGKSTCASTAV